MHFRRPRRTQILTEPSSHAANLEPSAALVRAQLGRILSSELFSRSTRLSAFLSFIVEQTLTGHGNGLKEQVIAVELYGKGPDFNGAVDPIVRVDARRLRDKLREYYASAPHDPVAISVPKGSYTPVFESLETARPVVDAARAPEVVRTGSESTPSRRWPRLLMAIAVLLVLAAGWVLIGIAPYRRSDRAPLRFFTVTAFPGWEGQVSLSPDGQVVVFARTGPDLSSSNDLWMKAVEGEMLRRLTDTPDVHEVGPVWSPDGRPEIAFMALDTKTPQQSAAVVVMSTLDGRQRKVTDGGTPTWAPDGQTLVVSKRLPNGTLGLFRLVVSTGLSEQLTSPSAEFSDVYPAVSPDGSTLAFMRFSRRTPQAAVFRVPMSGGEPQRLTDWVEPVAGLTWTPDSHDLLYSSADASGVRMYRIAAFGTEPARLVPELPITASAPSASRGQGGGTFRLAFVHGMADVGLRLIDLGVPKWNVGGGGVTRFCDSARMDTPGRFSRDGARVAFASNRSGSPQVWVADRDGSELHSVTAIAATSVNVGSWSPDGHELAFDAAIDGNGDIYVVRRDGGPLRQLTNSPSVDSDPEWSADGRWIYYVSDASGRAEIWRLPAEGGQATKITSGGGFEPREAPDGQTLYYVDRARRPEGLGAVVTLKQVPTIGGEERVVFPGVRAGTWDITDRGIVFLSTAAEFGRGSDALALYDFAERQVRELGTLPFKLARFKTPRLTVSRDGRWLLANHLDAWERDILVADNFR